MAEEGVRRSPSRPTRIKNLKDSEGRISITGTIISKNKDLSSFILDDGESQVLVLTKRITDFENVKEGQFVRVLGKIWGEGDEIEIQADIVQDFSKIDKELYVKTFY
ncbi:MAG: hypothetical protein JSW73_00145 [Candidatus Woesearchaeota archaeon]|nr:MAG: hypothetical protein JSW73_00145 [Candidatus Woesearchaeota archaeon]